MIFKFCTLPSHHMGDLKKNEQKHGRYRPYFDL